MSQLHRTLAQIEPLKNFYHAVRSLYRQSLYRFSPVLLARIRYRFIRARWPDFHSPRTFDEKLLWLMLYWRDPLITQCGDKYAMRSHVEQQGLASVLPKLFSVYRTTKEIDLESLPDRFVLKCSHGCKCNIFCRNKRELNLAQAKRHLDFWMKTDFSKVLGEVHYSGMQPRILCEEFLEEPGSELPTDFKVYCFDGKAHCTMVCSKRSYNGKPKLSFYDRDWEPLAYCRPNMKSERNIPKPSAYDKIIKVAEELSKPFPFVRMDFYSIKGRAVLGEMTFTPCACIIDYLTDLAQERLGQLLVIPSGRFRSRSFVRSQCSVRRTKLWDCSTR